MKNNIKLSEEKFTYADYESFVRLRDPQSLAAHRIHLSHFVRYFEGCERVLDLACGEGIFLDLLRESNISSIGVEADPAVVHLGASKGHSIIEKGVLEFLKTNHEQFDGVFCSHLIEHLPFESVLQLIQGVSKCLLPGGKFVLAFPNPRSLRSHLNMFWVDPQHVRFYDSSLINGVLQWSGFQIVSDSNDLSMQTSDYRFAPANLVNAIAASTARMVELERLVDPQKMAGIWQNAKASVISWFRERLGVSMLAREVVNLNGVLEQLLGLVDACDMEVRLVSKKLP